MIYIKNVSYLGQPHNLLISDGLVTTLAPVSLLPSDLQYPEFEQAEIIEATGLILFPSFIDAHVHLREPGFEWKEDVASGLNAAAHGGIGRVLCMANSDPVNDDASVTTLILEAAKRAHPNGPYVYPIAAATLGLEGKMLSPLGELFSAGCIAVSNDGAPLQNTEIVRRVMEYAADFGMILIDHCEDFGLAKGSHMNEGLLSGRMGIKGQPDVAEAIQIARDVLLAQYLDLPIHIAHISCRASLNVLSWAKEQKIKVTAETCPHYLLLDESAISGYKTSAKVNPPLRTSADVQAMREAIKTGLIDILVTDHAPHAAHEKEHPLDLTPNGISGLDTALSLMWSLIQEDVIDEEDLIRLYSRAPAKIFRLPHNSMSPGDSADFILFDPAQNWVVSPQTMYSKSANTPWLNQTLRGRVCGHWLNGVRIV